jgi:multidrug efflux pump subunit AcrA (membrane-fusion protein)
LSPINLKNLIYISLLLLTSCRQNEGDFRSLYTVATTTFEDALIADGTVESVNSLAVNCPQGVGGTIVYLVEDGAMVNEGDVVCRIEDPGLATELQDAQTNLEINRANLEKTYADQAMEMALLEAQIQNNEAEKAITGLSEKQLEFSPENQRRIRELELKQAAIQNSRFSKKLRTTKIIHQTEIRRQLMGLQRVEARVKQIEERIASMTLTAPRSGLAIRGINPMSDRKYLVSENAWEGLAIVMMPDMQQMKVRILASEGIYKRMKTGDRVEYSFDAQPGNKAWGKITMKAPVGRPIERNSKVKVFEVEASVDSSLMIPTPGMSTQCRIVLQQVPDTIVVPQIAVFDRDSSKVVYVKSKKGFEMRKVTTSQSSPSEIIITSGLTVGEQISLSKPDDKMIEKND